MFTRHLRILTHINLITPYHLLFENNLIALFNNVQAKPNALIYLSDNSISEALKFKALIKILQNETYNLPISF